MLYTARPGWAVAQAALDREGRGGWLYDDRVTPNADARPRVRAVDAPLKRFALDVATGAVTALPEISEPESAADRTMVASDTAGRLAWTQASDRTPFARARLAARVPDGGEIICSAESCLGGLVGAWWDRRGALLFLRREGFHDEDTVIYRWRPGAAPPVRAFVTRDVIQWCDLTKDDLLCLRENATTPRQVVLIEPTTGRTRVVFDPNPEFRSINLGRVERLKWVNDRGLAAWGDLVFPPYYRPGTKLPMVVVQYRSRGFLRGGTDDEYPIFPLAARGIAVMSFERPGDFALSDPRLQTAEQINAADVKDWAERRSVQSSIATGVKAAIATGNIDPARIGITGLSDGSTSARFALINSRLFAAAAISTCCIEPKTVMTYGGVAWAKFNLASGYPGVGVVDRKFWHPLSIAMNAQSIDTPILMQLADDEYILALEAFEALREAGKPVEAYVFPDEHHGKWQPAHRLAIYQRSIDWFRFWLQGEEDHVAEKRAQYLRWEAMRAAQGKSVTAGGS